MQQVVIFGYTVGVFYSYQVYSKSHENPSASREDVIRLEKDLNSRLGDLNQQVEMLNREIKKLSETQVNGKKISLCKNLNILEFMVCVEMVFVFFPKVE